MLVLRLQKAIEGNLILPVETSRFTALSELQVHSILEELCQSNVLERLGILGFLRSTSPTNRHLSLTVNANPGTNTRRDAMEALQGMGRSISEQCAGTHRSVL